MRRIKNLVIGGIENKVFNLILFTVLLLTAAYMAVSIHHSNMLTELASESNAQQQAAIGEITGQVMDAVVEQTLERSTRVEADIANAMFDGAAQRVRFVADRVTSLLADPDAYDPVPYESPDPADDGQWKAKVLYAEGVDPSDPAIVEKLGLFSNLSETLVSLCPAADVATVYIGIPEGAHLSVSATSSTWFRDGKLRSFDPRQRGWYQKAVREGGLVFTDGEPDANTGAYCVECAMPVYGQDGSLQAVVGTDLFLTEMEEVLASSTVEGEYRLLVNQNGCAVLTPQAEAFPLPEAERGSDLRLSSLPVLAKAVETALKGERTGVEQGALQNGQYYLTSSPIRATGWVLVSAFDAELSKQPEAMLTASLARIQEEAAQVYQENTGNSKRTVTVLLILVTLLTLAGALILGKRIVKPMNTITRRISELNEDNLEFKMDDSLRTGDEVEELAEAFASISHKTVEYMGTIQQVTAEKERISTELSLATKIQAAMLPHIFPAFPDRPEFDIYASMDPAKEVGGDFYDYFLVDDDHLCMVIADVSGKGVPAALFMMASKIILQSVAMLGRSPAEILAKTNDAIFSNNEPQMFVTVWVGILKLSTGKLTAANAGHEYPMIRRPGGSYELCKDKHGFVIGGMEGMRYKEYSLQLEPGARLFVYTDGVPEATNAKEELFGTERLVKALNTAPEAEPQTVLKNVRAAVDDFVQDAEQFDDMTMLCLEYRGPQAAEKED